MKKIIEEIVENNPELEKYKEGLEKAANLLEKNNPEILPSKEFKKSLKSRIEGIIGLKQGKKSNFVIFAMPVFSLLFIVGGFMYYYDDINFLGDGMNIYNAEKLTEEEILDIELEKVGELFEEYIPHSVSTNGREEATDINEKSSVNKGKIEKNILEDSVNKTIKTIEKTEDLSEDDMSEYINEIFGTETIDNEKVDEGTIEDNSILEIFESLDMDLNEESESINYDEASESNIIDDGGVFESNVMIETSFESFCESEGGELTGTGNTQKCITDKKECFASEFKNGICEFVEIK